MSEEGPTGFYARPHPSLGLVGKRPEIHCRDGVLMLRDEGGGGGFDVPAATVMLLRLGTMGTRSAIYHVAHLERGGGPSLRIMPAAINCPAYAATMRRFCAAVAEVNGLGIIERGLSRGAELGTLAICSVVALSGALMALFVWSREMGMAGAIGFCLAMLGVVALAAWQWSRDRPRPIASLDEIESELPGLPWWRKAAKTPA